MGEPTPPPTAPLSGPPSSVTTEPAPPPGEPGRFAVPKREVPIDDPRVGTALGKYQITGVLGRGGMGVVYEARDPLLRRKVAVKILPERLASDTEALQRFLLEARAASRLNHPNTVAVFDVDQRDGVYFLVMELVNGGSADDFLRRRGPFPWAEATRIAADVARGLSAAHAAGVLHRDVKPANIMRGLDGLVKLADFGLAKPVDGSATSITGVGNVILGTVAFMSPEQAQGGAIDHRTDVYALGATYFALLTGRPPFGDAKNSMKMMLAHCTEPVPDPAVLMPGLPAGCGEIIRKAMAKEPSDRYRTAKEMMDALETLLARATMSESAARWNDLVDAVRISKLTLPPVPPSVRPRSAPPGNAGARLAAWGMLGLLGAGLIAAALLLLWPRGS